MKQNRCAFAFLLAFLVSLPAMASREPDWSKGFAVLDGGRANPYQLTGSDLQSAIERGRMDVVEYPIPAGVTGLVPPYQPFKDAIEGPDSNPFSAILRLVFDGFTGIHTMDDTMGWLGLHPYPAESDTGVYSAPFPESGRPDTRLGFHIIDTPDGRGFTFSCMTCHSANLFGKTVLGMANRFSRAFDAFVALKKVTHLADSGMLETFAGATPGEAKMYDAMRANLRSVGAILPQNYGLDTSLAQTALSLARRNPDPDATKNEEFEKSPRPDLLDHFIADGKPAVWWNLKYKDRWFVDGSYVSGNPVYISVIVNEIGRGADLKIFKKWLEDNQNIVRDMTTAIFSTEAPRITDFFSPEKIDLASAKRGQTLFNLQCAECHGTYDKAWDSKHAARLPLAEQLKTTMVHYHTQTPVKHVGTDPNRAQGMASLAVTNRLALSQEYGIVEETQNGYIPPPLVGIWARWPYFHNGSAPTLCDVLTRHEGRAQEFDEVEANDPEKDFDLSCNGYPINPTGEVLSHYDTTREGMHNSGHDEGIFLDHGKEIFTPNQKRDIISFLQTL